MERDTFCRTSGDGMENEDITKEIVVKNVDVKCPVQNKKLSASKEISGKVPGHYTIYRPEYESKSLPPVIPKGKLYCLIPKLVKPKENTQSTFKKIREPKFVPIEPYKAAVNPIFPIKKQQSSIKNKNNLDINFLVSQMSDMKTSELQISMSEKKNSKNIENSDQEKEKLIKENEELRKDKDYMNSQLKFQLQVNAELKNLLVASVGEDLQTRVNVLTEDKLQLARQLLDTANNLSTHTEQIEFLAGQCEVWRSKFLASSVMIEELARWKAELLQKNSVLMESNKRTLQLISKLREMQIDILKNLRFLANLKNLNLPSSDIISLTSECLNISEQMVLHSGIGMPECLSLNDLDVFTENEKFAVKALKNLNQSLTATDEASKAIMNQAFYSKSAVQDSHNIRNNSQTNENLSSNNK